MDALLIWVAKEALSYFFGLLMRKLGHSTAEQHMLKVIKDAKPLPPDITPAEARNPNLTTPK